MSIRDDILSSNSLTSNTYFAEQFILIVCHCSFHVLAKLVMSAVELHVNLCNE